MSIQKFSKEMKDNPSSLFNAFRAIREIKGIRESSYREWAMWTREND
jgi:hypothetical protein